MRFLKLLTVLALALALSPAFAQTKPAAKPADNMQILREKLSADKKLLVAANMGLTAEEGKGFWPLYDAYQGELKAINDRLGKTIMAYADAYNKNALTNDMATKLTSEAIAVDEAEAKLRRTYLGKLEKVIPGVKAARYLQIESKIRALIRYELADSIPLAP